MKTKILSIFTRTPLHVGAGSSVGAVDMPIVRERHTKFPVIPGSSLKGVLADLWNDEANVDKDFIRKHESMARKIFGDNTTKGENACAGKVFFGEAKLLAFPIRSAKGCFAFITCPLAMQRFLRDTGKSLDVPNVDDNEVITNANNLCINDKIILEEYPLAVNNNPLFNQWVDELKDFCEDQAWKDNVAEHLVIVSNDLFAYFVENACEVANHNCIDDATGVAIDKALFCQENVPSEALFYSVLNTVDDKDGYFNEITTMLQKNNNLIQIGADITTGLGWCSVAVKENA